MSPALTRARRLIRGILHYKSPRMKHEENSIRGIRRAHALGLDGIDIDVLLDADGNPYGNHWPRPMERDGFKDTALRNRMPKDKLFHTMTPRQVRRLLAVTRGRFYRIRRLEVLLAECARLGVVAVLEPKGDKRLARDSFWQYIAKVADRLGATVSVRALPENAAALAPARRAGLEAWEIR